MLSPEILSQESQEIRNEILARCIIDSRYMARLFFPDAFFAPMTVLHDELFDFLDNNKSKKKLILATRGLGKTTIAQFIALKRILYGERKFVGYLSNSSTSAQFCTNTMKLDLTANKEVRKIWGDISSSRVEGMEEKWATTSWIGHVADTQTIVVPRGAGQQVRGLLWNHSRPDLWIIDDLEDDEEINNEEQRKKLRKWWYGAFIHTVSQWEKYTDYEMVYIDTMKHEDALPTYLIDDGDWDVLTLSVCDSNYKTLVPDFISQETIDKELKKHRKNRTMDVFARERMVQPSSKEAASFKQEYFKYYDENDEHFVDVISKRLINILIHDPSRTKNPKNAQSAFVVYGLDFEYNTFYIRLAQGWYFSPKEAQDKMIELLKQYKIQVFGLELTGLEEHILHPIKNELIRQKMFGVHIIPLNPRTGKGELKGEDGGKDGRILSMLPYLERGLVKINAVGCGPLEQQWLSYPRAKKKDISDAAGYLGQMLEKGQKYMSPQEVDEDGYTEDEEAAYRELENEPSFTMGNNI